MPRKKGKKDMSTNNDKALHNDFSHQDSLISDFDAYLFNEGNHVRLYKILGAHPLTVHGKKGIHFAVWAPNAKQVCLMADFNGWSKIASPLTRFKSSGIWFGFFTEISKGHAYKYHILSHHDNLQVDKADPFAFYAELPPQTASIIWESDYQWQDEKWMQERIGGLDHQQPISIYEIHLGSWRRVPEQKNRFLTYRELAKYLPNYIKELGFTHVEFLPVMEHPFYGSWGYQTTGYFAPTSRYGNPDDFKFLIDTLHQNNIGVILDWVPSHFPTDAHGLAHFDGTHLYEHADPRLGFHPDWKSAIFNYGRHEVRSFLYSSALFWLDQYHVDGLRVDAVASMLYLDYSRKPNEWIPNQFGGRENIDALQFLRHLNEEIYQNYPEIQSIAEESTAWGMVSRPTYIGGLGFGYKWDMGWMHDTLHYLSLNPIFRSYHHDQLTFRLLYAFTENFVLPLSHDEVVHGKGSLLGKMPGDDWQKFANLRLLLGYLYTQPGKKLLFMGGEWGQWQEWNHDSSLEWHLLQNHPHQGIKNWVQTLNTIYRSLKPLHELDTSPDGFEWVDCSDYQQSIISFMRRAKNIQDQVLVIFNFTPQYHQEYRMGVPLFGAWEEIANSDRAIFGGSDKGNFSPLLTEIIPFHQRPYSLLLTIPPLAIILLKPVSRKE